MRTAETLLSVAVAAAWLMAGPALAFDGSKTDANAMPTPPEVASLPPSTDDATLRPPADIPNVSSKAPPTAAEAFRTGTHWLKEGDTQKAVVSLEYAAENGHPLAQWKLGRMYADGDGVAHNDLKAFEYFERVANAHADDNPDTREARFVANAFVALGRYYLSGIPHSAIKRDPARARCSPTPPLISAIRKRSITWRAYTLTASARRTMRAWRRAGSPCRRTRGCARRKPCSAPCCSPGTTFRARPHAG